MLLAQLIVKRPEDPRGLLPLAVAAAALILTLGVGAAAFVVPALVVLVLVWARRAWPREVKLLARDLGLLSVVTVLMTLPVWITVSEFLGNRAAGLFSSGAPTAEDSLGNLLQPLSGWQLAGIWPVGDFRLRAPSLATALLVGVALLMAVAAIWMTVRRRQLGVAAYVAIALVGCAIYYLIGATPWVIGKALAISSPALLVAALTGAVMLWGMRSRYRLAGVAGALAALAIAGGVAWSNVLIYHDVLLAPHARLAELAHVGQLLEGKGPTFVNEYEVYADRHFLRAGAPVEPAEYREASLPLRDGTILTKSAEADLDSFPLSTLEPYRSIVTRRTPAESRPPSIYQLVWQGRYYQLWQRPAVPATRILEHVPLGESNTLPYCGASESGANRPLCSMSPVAIPPCPEVRRLGRKALSEHAQLVAYQRPGPVFVRGDQDLWPLPWYHGVPEHLLTPSTPGRAVAHIAVASGQRYELWLFGNFSRGFEVSVDGQHVGTVRNQLSGFGTFVPVAQVFLEPGVHTVVLTYPHAGLGPGSGDAELTSLSGIALEPLQSPPSELISVAPQNAATLCGRTLDWIELVTPAT